MGTKCGQIAMRGQMEKEIRVGKEAIAWHMPVR